MNFTIIRNLIRNFYVKLNYINFRKKFPLKNYNDKLKKIFLLF